MFVLCVVSILLKFGDMVMFMVIDFFLGGFCGCMVEVVVFILCEGGYE